MNSNKKTAMIVGALFLTAMFTAMLDSELLGLQSIPSLSKLI